MNPLTSLSPRVELFQNNPPSISPNLHETIKKTHSSQNDILGLNSSLEADNHSALSANLIHPSENVPIQEKNQNNDDSLPQIKSTRELENELSEPKNDDFLSDFLSKNENLQTLANVHPSLEHSEDDFLKNFLSDNKDSLAFSTNTNPLAERTEDIFMNNFLLENNPLASSSHTLTDNHINQKFDDVSKNINIENQNKNPLVDLSSVFSTIFSVESQTDFLNRNDLDAKKNETVVKQERTEVVHTEDSLKAEMKDLRVIIDGKMSKVTDVDPKIAKEMIDKKQFVRIDSQKKIIYFMEGSGYKKGDKEVVDGEEFTYKPMTKEQESHILKTWDLYHTILLAKADDAKQEKHESIEDKDKFKLSNRATQDSQSGDKVNSEKSNEDLIKRKIIVVNDNLAFQQELNKKDKVKDQKSQSIEEQNNEEIRAAVKKKAIKVSYLMNETNLITDIQKSNSKINPSLNLNRTIINCSNAV